MRLFSKTGLLFLPLYVGLLFFAASLTPSLIPRSWLVQGGLGGLMMGLGYFIGRIAVSIWRVMGLPDPSRRTALIARFVIGIPVVCVVAFCLHSARAWQNGIRSLMGMDLIDSTHTVRMIALALAVFFILILLGYALKWLFDRVRFRLYRYMPARAANVAGLLITMFAVFIVSRDGVLDTMIDAMDESYATAQELFETAPAPPIDSDITGGENSLVDWDALGEPGRNFVLTGPTSENIESFTGRNAVQPIRVYVGRAQEDTAQARADVALAELQRQGGFDRDVLIVAMPTGTGWLDPGAMDPVEYMHGGNIATVSVQYSYLQSPLALIFETSSGLDQAEALISTVHGYWKTLPTDTRPKIYMHGLSLGAWSSMSGTDIFALLDDPIDGAFWVGPPFPSTMWKLIVAARDSDSTYVAPTLGDDQLVRFASHTNGGGNSTGWGDMRIAYLQYSSDPIVFYENSSTFREPTWMSEPAAADVSPDLRFIPFVTQFQLAVDMALATTVPVGHGHSYYGSDYVGPWAAVTAPKDWTDHDTTRLMSHCDGGYNIGCDNE
jgi:uncharacterized membrane protein